MNFPVSSLPENKEPASQIEVAVAMSGGVDSSVAAALLLERGYNVTGVAMRLWTEAEEDNSISHPVDHPAENARRVCEVLGIPFKSLDCRAAFKAAVVDYFIESYSQGRTPNPCVACNRYIKFGLLLDQIKSAGIGLMATGHYVRAIWQNGLFHLLRGCDTKKDQSYFLYRLTQKDLAHLIFPLGDYTKDQIRQMAEARRLPVAHRPESQETCFIRDNDYRRFLRQYSPENIAPGPIVDTGGQVLGTHQGLPFYTIGQRSGLGISAPYPLFVLDIIPEENVLVVGSASELGHCKLKAIDVSYVAGQPPQKEISVMVKIRYQARFVRATLVPAGVDTADVLFDETLRDITPGQSAVFYQDDEVLGGGIIDMKYG